MELALTKQEIDAAYAAIDGVNLPTMPETVQQANFELGRPDPDLVLLSDLICNDPVLSGEVVRLVNSPYYGLRREVASVQQAVMLLGIRKLKLLLITAGLRKVLKGSSRAHEKFWQHSSAVAACAANIATMVHDVSPDKAFMAGLFQDAGMLVFLGMNKAYEKIIDLQNSHPYQVIEREEQQMQTDHCSIGYLLSLNWNVPSDVALAVLYSHLDEYSVLENPKIRALVAICQLSSTLVAKETHPLVEESEEWVCMRDRALDELVLSIHDVEELAAEFLIAA